jgi:glycosyltransferase involved in cell wall biosynthesis
MEIRNNLTNNKPFISIIIATYNTKFSIQRCLNSIIQQSFQNFEILVKDGLSTDQTISILNSKRKFLSYFDSSKDNGIYDAWNKALPHSRGEWICFLGADDYFINNNVLSKYTTFLKTIDYSTNGLVYGVNQIVNTKGEVLYYVGKPWHELKTQFNNYMSLPHQGLMHHRLQFENVGYFDKRYRIAGDYDWILRSIQYQTPIFWPNVVCATPIGGISTVPKNNIICLIENRRAQKKNRIKPSIQSVIIQWTVVIIRFSLWYLLGEQRSRIFLDYVRYKRGLSPYWTQAI